MLTPRHMCVGQRRRPGPTPDSGQSGMGMATGWPGQDRARRNAAKTSIEPLCSEVGCLSAGLYDLLRGNHLLLQEGAKLRLRLLVRLGNPARIARREVRLEEGRHAEASRSACGLVPAAESLVMYARILCTFNLGAAWCQPPR